MDYVPSVGQEYSEVYLGHPIDLFSSKQEECHQYRHTYDLNFVVSFPFLNA
ncbi:hypothetical protein HMI56_005178 [Coelomomyces lativittatus]|nr:hypothetical protein HMI56_005178 [Coelomomyces lativittatus]